VCLPRKDTEKHQRTRDHTAQPEKMARKAVLFGVARGGQLFISLRAAKDGLAMP
jgi:hypothetical protein